MKTRLSINILMFLVCTIAFFPSCEKEKNISTYMATFTVKEEGTPIEGARITIEDYTIPSTNIEGVTSVDLPEGTYSYAVIAEGYDDKIGSITISGANNSENINMIVTVYMVNFNVMVNGMPIDGAEITVEGYTISNTNTDGVSSIEMKYGDYNYTVRKYGYVIFEKNLILDGKNLNKFENIGLTANTYTVTFRVIEEPSNPIQDATVILQGYPDLSTTTNQDGEAVVTFNFPLEEDIVYSISKQGSDIISGATINIKDKILSEHASGERDWDYFTKLVNESDMPDSELVIRVISMYTDPEVLIKEIKNLAAAYEYIQDNILPKVDQVSYTINISK